MASLPINPFDAAIYLCLVVAVIMGFNSGLLRSLATIFGYVAAMAVAVAAAPFASQLLGEQLHRPVPGWAILVAMFLVAGVTIGALLRYVLSEIVGPDVSVLDRMLGAVRILLVAVLIVVIFDHIIPADREPSFLAESRLRPILSQAGRQGLRSLPPEVESYIDRLKRERGI